MIPAANFARSGGALSTFTRRTSMKITELPRSSNPAISLMKSSLIP